ncbi:MAG: DUF2452 domain-containing protein [Flavobacteriales bacterium]
MKLSNPIDKDKTTETPSTLPYPHHIGSIAVRPEDKGKIKGRAYSAMLEQTGMQLQQIQKQVELLAKQANEIRRRVEVSEMIYQAKMTFEPFAGHVYHVYERAGEYLLMMIAPDEWGKSKRDKLQFIASVRLLSDHTWEIVEA